MGGRDVPARRTGDRGRDNQLHRVRGLKLPAEKDLPDRIRAAAPNPLPGWRSLQKDFAPADARTGETLRLIPDDPGSARRAAVLVPILTEPAALVYTVRRSHLNDHAGQISFPGGSVDAADESLLATALREAEEEIGLHPDKVEVVGEMEDMYIPPSNFLVRPVVGLLKPGSRFEISPEEVEEVFSVSIEHLTHPKTVQRRRWNRSGLDLDVPVFAVNANGNTYDIWGATAAITASLLTRIGWKSPLEHR